MVMGPSTGLGSASSQGSSNGDILEWKVAQRVRVAVVTLTASTVVVVAASLIRGATARHDGRAWLWFLAIAMFVMSAALLRAAARFSRGFQARIVLWVLAIVAVALGAVVALNGARTWGDVRTGSLGNRVVQNDSAVVWSASAVLLLLTGTLALSGPGSIAPMFRGIALRDRRPARSPRRQSDWDMRSLFPNLRHWETPTLDDDKNEAPILREIREAEAVALSRAAIYARRARNWERAQYGIGVPAAIFAGAAGASGIAGLGGTSAVVIGVFGLVGSALTSVSTGLNSGRKAQEAATTSARYEAVARNAHVFRTTTTDASTGETTLHQIVDRLNAMGISDEGQPGGS